MIYLVIAYRWGHTNGHQYIPYAGFEREAAFNAAEHESDWRGGKYGIAVYEREDHGEDGKLVAYHPSTFGESLPTHNFTTDMLITVGLAARNWVEDGKAWLPSDDELLGLTVVNYTEVDTPPKWLIDRVKKEDDMAKFMSELRSGKIDKAEILGVDMGVPNENS